ncbi:MULTISPECIES: hypothetical protein [unclassified Streptosporangium]|uniref:hypothetical protein n=1 Tax=unclassified Streptosporangium TaxID=2632669 RepID=UPI002E27F907|nr:MULTISPECIES: hypothetical protein [unclassified Streptosporangium]
MEEALKASAALTPWVHRHVDEASVAAFGQNPLSPATRRPSAEAGRARAAAVAAFWAA